MEKKWTVIIQPKNKLLDFRLKEVWKYRDLIWLSVQRNFKTLYKQTVLGPIWFIIQPLFTTIIQTFVFGTIANMSTDGVPQILFYMLGNITWQFFNACFIGNANTFTANAGIFGKIYFPRLTAPITNIITSFLNSMIQFGMFFCFELFFMISGSTLRITWVATLTPLIYLQLAILGMGVGIIISSLTTKYRDLQVFVSFASTLWMYVSPVIYSVTTMTNVLPPKILTLMMLNPVTPALELMRYGWLGSGTTPFGYWGISWGITFVVLFFGLMLFNKIEKTFMDTV